MRSSPAHTLEGVVISGYYDFDSGQVRVTIAHNTDHYVMVVADSISAAFWRRYRAGMTVRVTYQPGTPTVITAYTILA